MAVAVDASSPIRFAGTPATGGTITSASFTAPANSLLVVAAETDGDNLQAPSVSVSDSGGLSWTKQVERTAAESTIGGLSALWTAPQTSSASRTVTCTFTFSGGGTLRISAKVYVCTGTDLTGTPVDTVGANNEGGSTSDSITTSTITPGADGMLFAADCDWMARGVFDASSDLTQNTATYAGQISVCDGYHTTTSGVGAHANLNANNSGAPQHKWCQITVRQPPSGDTQEWSSCFPLSRIRQIVNISY